MCVLKALGGDGRVPGALSRCSSLSSINTSSGVDIESPSDTASSLFTHHLVHRSLTVLLRGFLLKACNNVGTGLFTTSQAVCILCVVSQATVYRD